MTWTSFGPALFAPLRQCRGCDDVAREVALLLEQLLAPGRGPEVATAKAAMKKTVALRILAVVDRKL